MLKGVLRKYFSFSYGLKICSIIIFGSSVKKKLKSFAYYTYESAFENSLTFLSFGVGVLDCSELKTYFTIWIKVLTFLKLGVFRILLSISSIFFCFSSSWREILIYFCGFSSFTGFNFKGKSTPKSL